MRKREEAEKIDAEIKLKKVLKKRQHLGIDEKKDSQKLEEMPDVFVEEIDNF